MSRPTLAFSLAVLLLGAAVLGACNSTSPPLGPELTCAKSCETRAPVCARDECRRGCNLILDRLAEGEGDNVIACIAKASPAHGRACTDRAWARCAARIGVHADGGPPAPPPASDIEDEDSE